MTVKPVLTSEVIFEFTERKRAFAQAFGDPPGKDVLEFLAVFCRARETTAVGDRDMTYLLEGRRQVYLLIQDYLNLTPEQLIPKDGRFKPSP